MIANAGNNAIESEKKTLIEKIKAEAIVQGKQLTDLNLKKLSKILNGLLANKAHKTKLKQKRRVQNKMQKESRKKNRGR